MPEFRPMRMVDRQPEHNVSVWSDLVNVFRMKVEHRWKFMLLAVTMPILFVIGFIQEFTHPIQYHPPEVIYMKTWDPNRTDAEIRAQQLKDLPKELADRREIEQARAKRRAQARAIAEAMGIDVDR